MEIEQLKQQIPYQWRVQSFSKYDATATCVAYIDARDVMDLLDKVCGSAGWQSDFKEVSGQIYGGVAIHSNGEWIWKWDTGSESNVEKEKGQASDAFKRAAVKWGVGRFLYDLPIKKVKTNEKLQIVNGKTNNPYVVDDSGKRVYDLTKHINGTGAPVKTPVAQPAKPRALENDKNARQLKMKDRIHELATELSKQPFLTDEELPDIVKEATGIEFVPENYERIGKQLKEMTQTPNKN